MKNILCIMRRDLLSYFISPIGYIFMMVFVTMSVGLYVTSFFTFPMADMRPYFDNLPILLCVFIPAVTMRLWAEERKENTWEMLLTFPMKAYELVLGKFFAAVIFFALTLFATVTVPAMLVALGSPDTGAIISGYFGTLLLGALFLALGIFFSGFFKDQIVAFVVALLTCFLLFLLGTDFIAAFIDDKMAGLGSLLSDLLGFFRHFTAFTRGVIDLADVFYFLAWTVLFLVLNTLYIDGRNRPGARLIFGGAVAICLGIGLLFNYVMEGASLKRFDVTEDKIYTVSEATKSMLKDLEAPAQIKVYITPKSKMPTVLNSLERDITDKLEELRVGAGGNLEFTVVHLEVANIIAEQQKPEDEEEEKSDEDIIEKRMLDKGVEPFSISVMGGDEFTNKYIYSSIGIGYKDQAEEIVPRIVPDNLQDLEYRIVSTVYKLSLEKKPVVALVAPSSALDPQMRQIYEQMGQPVPQTDDPFEILQRALQYEKYDVQRVEMTKESPLPDEYDTLVVVNPKGFNERQRWEINRAVHSGKSVILAVQQYEWDYRVENRGLNLTKREQSPGVNELLDAYGLEVSEDVLMDENDFPLTVGGGPGLMGMLNRQQVTLPLHILLNNASMAEDNAITNRLANILYLWGTPIEMDEDKLGELGLSTEVLMNSSERAWTISKDEKLTQAALDGPPLEEREAFPLMAMVQGQFPDAFEGKERPKWPKPQQRPGQPPMPPEEEEEAPAEAVEAAPGKMVLLGSSQMLRREFLGNGGPNLSLLLNSVDAVALSEKLVGVRSHKPIDRTIDRPTAGQRGLWRAVNYALANLVIAAVGIAVFATRRRSRDAYTMEQARKAAAN